jgi:hypothetical protein
MDFKKLKNQITSIGESFVYVFKDIETEREELRNERLSVCKSCPLFQKSDNRSRCNPNLLIDPISGQVKLNTLDNLKNYPTFKSGCGCTLENYGNPLGEKITVIGHGNTCPAGKWNRVESEFLEVIGDSNEERIKEVGITQYAYENNLKLRFKNDPNKTELE